MNLYAEINTSGKIFYNYTKKSENDQNAFNVKRAYLTIYKKESDKVSYNITYDIGSNDGGSAYTAFLKIAMINWKTNLGDFSIGMQNLNMFKTMENTWGHRFIRKMSMDLYGFSPSADLGIGLTRRFGMIQTSALITNGGGYKTIEDDEHKKLSLHMVYGNSKLNKEEGFNFGGSFSLEPYNQLDESKVENKKVLGVFAGFSGFGFRGGLEHDRKWTINRLNSTITSFYGTYQFSEKISFLGRIDKVDYNNTFFDNEEREVILGFHYLVGYGMTIAPTFRMIITENEESTNLIVVNFEFKF